PVGDVIEQWKWSSMEKNLYALMSSKSWGPRWKELTDAMVKFEASTYWLEHKLPNSTERPDEVGAWMKEHRRPGDYDKISPKFGKRLLAWWRDVGPKQQREPRPEGLAADEVWPSQKKEDLTWEHWCSLRRTGTNGFMLLVQALTWWGQAIVNEN
ncbi:hypothetical protein B0H11DRAFT_1616657, partial [Mycena galericulata]